MIVRETTATASAIERQPVRGDGRAFRRRSGKWYIAYYQPDENSRSRERRELGGDTEKEARKLLRARLFEVAQHKAGFRKFQGPSQERVLLKDILEALERNYEIHERKSLAQLRSRLKRVREIFK